MSFLGLVGIPATPITYPTYQGLKALSPALGAAFAGAEAAAVAAIAAKGAAILGAGALGWMIGSAIREQLLPEGDDPPLSTWATGGTDGQQIFIEWTFYNGINAPISSDTPVTGRFAGFLRRSISANDDEFYVRQIAPPLNIPVVSFNRAGFPNARIEITGFRNPDGTPNTTPRKVPVLPQTAPYTPVRVPTTIPATPRYPAIPITPTVIPTPGNDPDEDDILRLPGITVQIPELGLQIQYTPTDVRIGRYTNPETRPTDPPKIGIEPGTPPPAKDPCECDEGESKDEEILCRIKALQKELLFDGYTTETHLQGASSYISVDNLPDEFYRLEISVTQAPANVKTQYYSVDDAKVEWVGWLSWNFGGRKSERIFLQFRQMGFAPPPGCQGYTIAMNSGCQALALALTRKKDPYIDECVNV